MPIARVQMPDGRIARLEVPEGTSPQQVESFALEMADKPASVSIGESLRQIPRQMGLAARYGVEGLADVAGIVTEPIRAVANPVLRATGLPGMPSTREMVSGAADAVGLPSPQGANERVVGDATRMMAGGGGLGAVANKVSKVLTGTPKFVADAMAANQGVQTVSSAGAGAAGGSIREAGGGPWEQFGGAVVGGLTGAGVSMLAQKTYGAISNAITQYLTPKSDITQVTVTLNQILAENGIDVSKIPAMARAELSHEVKKALDTGKDLNPDVVRRIADYAMVGATPTRGTVTLDPVQLTQEKNLAKVGANSSDPRLQELARVQNANNGVFIKNLNDLGGNTANANPVTAGSAAMGHIRASDDAARATENALYKQARDSSGRAIELDRNGFVMDAYRRLGESNKSAFLPAEIKSLLEQIRAGKLKIDGQEIDVPFNVDVIDSLKTTLASASRGAKDGNVKAAIANVRDALENTQPTAVGRPVGGNQVVDPAALAGAQTRANTASAESMAAFDEARRFARSRRDWQESTPGIMAALSDDAQPDRFVRDFVIGNSNKGATAHVEALMHEFHNNPAAQRAIKENVVGYLKSKALSGSSDEVGSFSQSAYNRALNDLGDAKLRLFFSADEIAQLKALGRVSSYEMIQPKGSAVNNSNTTSAAAGLLDKIASSKLLARIPLAEPAIQGPARNWSTQIGTAKALDAGGAIARQEPSREMLRLEQLLGPGLLLTSPRTDGRDDKKRH